MSGIENFENRDEPLLEQASRLVEERARSGLEGLVGGLAAVVINTEPANLRPAVEELLATTCHGFDRAWEDAEHQWFVLKCPGSADIIVKSRKRGVNPFARFSDYDRVRALPNTRIETFVFETPDLEAYNEVQRGRGVEFDGGIWRGSRYSYLQTPPLDMVGISYGFVQWTSERSRYACSGAGVLPWRAAAPFRPWLDNVGRIDHAATRVRAQDRDAAIVQFMQYTNYKFDFSIYVPPLNSITNVARMPGEEFALVFTSGIRPYGAAETPGPTESFIRSFGPRVHHVAFRTKQIEATFEHLKAEGVEFLSDLVGGPEEGLKQAFTATSPNTLLVTEYIYRYAGFDGFFTKGNVAQLTEATAKQ